MKNNFKWLNLIFFIPLLLIVPFVNYFGDAANLFVDDDINNIMAQEIVNGKEVYFVGGNGNERQVKKNLIIEMPEHVDTVTIGSSLIMCVSDGIVGTDSFYNLGTSSADFYDQMAQFGLMEVYEKKVDRIIFNLLPAFFNEDAYSSSARDERLKPYAEYMISILDGEEIKVEDIEENDSIKTQIEQLFSVSYFQSSISFLRSKGIRDMFNKTAYGIVDSNFDNQASYYMADGSWVYDSKTMSRSESDVIESANKYDLEANFSKTVNISERRKEYFEKLIMHCKDNNIEIDLFLCHLPPVLWDRMDIDVEEYPFLYELEDYANEVAEKYGLRIIGSYNPHTLGILNAEFYDAWHIRREALDKYFDFIAQNK